MIHRSMDPRLDISDIGYLTLYRGFISLVNTPVSGFIIELGEFKLS